MDDAVLVRVVDRPRHLHHDRERARASPSALGRALGERLALQVSKTMKSFPLAESLPTS